MKCNFCNFDNNKNANYCEHCGKSLFLLCSNCGERINEDSKVCKECGHTVHASLQSSINHSYITMKCTHCGEKIKKDDERCQHCGFNIKENTYKSPTYLCPKCGYYNKDNSQCCENCGYKFNLIYISEWVAMLILGCLIILVCIAWYPWGIIAGIFGLGYAIKKRVLKLFQPFIQKRTRQKNLEKMKTGAALSKEFKDKFPIPNSFSHPVGINSAEMGVLLHHKVSSLHFLSLLYWWKFKKIIDIEVIKKQNGEDKIRLTKLQDIPKTSPHYEKEFFYRLFYRGGILKFIEFSRMSEFDLTRHLDNLHKFVIEQGRFTNKKDSEGNMIETEKGAKLIVEILGYRNFFLTCDEKIIQEKVQEDPLFFDRNIAFRVLFGIETEFLKTMIPILDDNIDPGDGFYGLQETILNPEKYL